MHSTRYPERALDLVNPDLTATETPAAAMAHRPWLAERVNAADLCALRSVRGELAALVVASADGQRVVVVEVLNRTLARNPLRPIVSGHDECRWHLHVNDEGATVAETLTCEAMMGSLLFVTEVTEVTEVGAGRLGRWASSTCTRSCVDPTANRSRRCCRSRWSTRECVAALRRRRAAGVHR